MARKRIASLVVAALVVGVVTVGVAQAAGAGARHRTHSRHTASAAAAARSSTPIKHLVVIFQENVSFDHYFGTYPNATNPAGEPPFHAVAATPRRSTASTATLLTNNPNRANPPRLDRAQALTCDQDHGYTDEQKAYDMGLMDKFVQFTDVESCSPHRPGRATPRHGLLRRQHGHRAVELRPALRDERQLVRDDLRAVDAGRDQRDRREHVRRDLRPASAVNGDSVRPRPRARTPATPGHRRHRDRGRSTGDPDPNYDVCSATQDHAAADSTIQMGGQNIGDLLEPGRRHLGLVPGRLRQPELRLRASRAPMT